MLPASSAGCGWHVRCITFSSLLGSNKGIRIERSLLKEIAMRTETSPGVTTSYVPRQRLSRPGTIEPVVPRGALATRSTDLSAEHDATLLVAALGDLEAQRAVIEWLVDADLLRLCLI